MAYVPRLTPKGVSEKNNDNLRAAFEMVSTAQGMGNFSPVQDPEYDYLKQAEEFQNRANNTMNQVAIARALSTQKQLDTIPRPKVNVNVVKTQASPQKAQRAPAAGNNNSRLQAFIQAVSGQESGGNYGAVNRDSGAAGKYQIMPANFVNKGGWDFDALGRDISLQEYMNNPKIQEKIARTKLREYFRKYGAAGAASAWYSGSPNNYNSTTSQGAYPSISRYVQDILNKMG